MFLWPIYKFWEFSSCGFVLACVWNLYELIKKPMPFAGEAFGIICGCKGRRVK